MATKNSEEKNKSNSSSLLKDLFSLESLKCILLSIILIGVAIGLSFILGQYTYIFFETNASNTGHMYSIIASAIAFFFFIKYLRKKKDIKEIRIFILLYFIIYFVIVSIILVFLYENVSYFLSTLGNSLILFSIFTLIIFLLNPGILGINSGNFKKIFSEGKQVRVILIYLIIVFMQVFGFSLLNYAISWFSWFKGWTSAYNVSTPPGNWFDFIYYSFITFATIGFGDVFPLIPAAKFSAIIQAVTSHIVSILFLAILFVYISSNFKSIPEKA